MWCESARSTAAVTASALDLLRSEGVAGADDTRGVAGRAESVGEGGGCPPAGAVPRGDDPRVDEFFKVAYGRVDAILDGGACEVVATEQEVDGVIRAESSGFESDVDDACV